MVAKSPCAHASKTVIGNRAEVDILPVSTTIPVTCLGKQHRIRFRDGEVTFWNHAPTALAVAAISNTPGCMCAAIANDVLDGFRWTPGPHMPREAALQLLEAHVENLRCLLLKKGLTFYARCFQRKKGVWVAKLRVPTSPQDTTSDKGATIAILDCHGWTLDRTQLRHTLHDPCTGWQHLVEDPPFRHRTLCGYTRREKHKYRGKSVWMSGRFTTVMETITSTIRPYAVCDEWYEHDVDIASASDLRKPWRDRVVLGLMGRFSGGNTEAPFTAKQLQQYDREERVKLWGRMLKTAASASHTGRSPV